MFLPFDIPLVGKKAIHRRSKTISIVENHNKSSQFPNHSPSLKSQRGNSKSTHIFRHIIHKKPTQKQNHQFISMRKMTQKIQQLINKELQYPQFISSINRCLKKKQKNHSPQINNPERKNQFSDNFTRNKVQGLDESKIREAEYLTLLKNSQKLNSKSFIPHFNWKQKLTRLKNMGNYGHVFKKKPQKVTEHTRVFIKSYQQDQLLNSGKVNINSKDQNKFLQNAIQFKNLKKIKRYYTINEQILQEKQISLKRYNKTCLMGQKMYTRSIASDKKSHQFKPNRYNDKLGNSSDREWNFGPWDDARS